MDVGPVYRGWQYALYIRPGESVITHSSETSSVSAPQPHPTTPRDQTIENTVDSQTFPRVNEPVSTSKSERDSYNRKYETLSQNDLAQQVMVGQKFLEAGVKTDLALPSRYMENDQPRDKDRRLNDDSVESVSHEIDRLHYSKNMLNDAIVRDTVQTVKTNASQPVNSGEFLRFDNHVKELNESVNRTFTSYQTNSTQFNDRMVKEKEHDVFTEKTLTIDLNGARDDKPIDLNPKGLGETAQGSLGEKVAAAAVKGPDESMLPDRKVGVINMDSSLAPSDSQPWPPLSLPASGDEGEGSNVPKIEAPEKISQPTFAGNILENPPENVIIQRLDVERDHKSIPHDSTRNWRNTDVFRWQDSLKTQFNSVSHDVSIYTESIFYPLDYFPVKREIVETSVLDRGQFFDSISSVSPQPQPQNPLVGDVHQKVEQYPMAANLILSEGQTQKGDLRLEGKTEDPYTEVGMTKFAEQDKSFSPEPIYKDVVEREKDYKKDDIKIEISDRVMEQVPLFSRNTEKRMERVDNPPDIIEPNQLTKKITEESKYSRNVVATTETELVARPIEYYDGYAWSRTGMDSAEESEKIAALEKTTPLLAVNEIYTTHSDLKGLTIDKLVVDWSR